MSIQREIVLDSIRGLIERPEVSVANKLLDEWSLLAEDRLFKAACHYLIHFVIPSLNGKDCADKPLPIWVDRILFHPLEYKPQEVDWEEWMTFIGSNSAYVREDCDHGKVLLERLPLTKEGALVRKSGVHCNILPLGKEPTLGHFSRRSDDNVLEFSCLFQDFDGDKAQDWEKILNSPVQPSLVVETRRGWHAYWPLNASTTNSLWLKVQSAMRDYFDADRGVLSPSHSLRIPGSWHCKELWKEGGEAFHVQLVHATWKKFRVEDLEIAFPSKEEKIVRRMVYKPIDGVRLPSTNYLPSGMSHDTLVSEAGRVYANVLEENAASCRKIVVEWFMSFKENKKASDEKEAQRRCDELEIKQYGRVVSR